MNIWNEQHMPHMQWVFSTHRWVFVYTWMYIFVHLLTSVFSQKVIFGKYWLQNDQHSHKLIYCEAFPEGNNSTDFLKKVYENDLY